MFVPHDLITHAVEHALDERPFGVVSLCSQRFVVGGRRVRAQPDRQQAGALHIQHGHDIRTGVHGQRKNPRPQILSVGCGGRLRHACGVGDCPFQLKEVDFRAYDRVCGLLSAVHELAHEAPALIFT